jgi:hypothetical protein
MNRARLIFAGRLCLLAAIAVWFGAPWHYVAMLLPVALIMPILATCTIFSDDFTTDRTATAYSIRSGSFAVSGGAMTASSATSLIVANSAASSSATAVRAVATITPASTSDAGRLIAGYVDDNNYWFAELQTGSSSGTLKLFQRSGGANTQRGSTSTIAGYTSGSKTVVLCLTAGAVYTMVGSNVIEFAATPTVASTKGGLGTGSISSSVSFDNFTYSKHKVQDPTCEGCSSSTTGTGSTTICRGTCLDGTVHGSVQLVVTGITNGGCTDCGSLNGTFVATRKIGSCSGGSACYYDTGLNVCDVRLIQFAYDGGSYSAAHSAVAPGCLAAGCAWFVAGGSDCTAVKTLGTPVALSTCVCTSSHVVATPL